MHCRSVFLSLTKQSVKYYDKIIPKVLKPSLRDFEKVELMYSIDTGVSSPERAQRKRIETQGTGQKIPAV